MKFCCVTACLNADEYIEKTMLSVLSQNILSSDEYFLEYIIKDGGSSDNTLSIINQVKIKYEGIKNIKIRVISSPDKGLYDALSSAFQYCRGANIYSYLNAGDLYSEYAFEIVSEIFSEQNVQFLTGLDCTYNHKSHLINKVLPFKYDKKLLLSGYYGTLLPNIQQESTFWSRNLHDKLDYELLSAAKLAGDFLIWKTFIRYSPLYIVAAHLGGFKVHKGQLSERFRDTYLEELKSIAEPKTYLLTFLAVMHKVIWFCPNIIKLKLSKTIYLYNHQFQKYELSNPV